MFCKKFEHYQKKIHFSQLFKLISYPGKTLTLNGIFNFVSEQKLVKYKFSLLHKDYEVIFSNFCPTILHKYRRYWAYSHKSGNTEISNLQIMYGPYQLLGTI